MSRLAVVAIVAISAIFLIGLYNWGMYVGRSANYSVRSVDYASEYVSERYEDESSDLDDLSEQREYGVDQDDPLNWPE